MHEYADRLTAGSTPVEEELEREFEVRLVESSKLAFRIAYSVLRQRQDAEDVAQEAFLFRVEVTLEESSVYMGDKSLTPAPLTAPSFRTFKLTNNVVLKDGQTTQVTSAADPLTGDIVRVDLTLNVVK